MGAGGNALFANRRRVRGFKVFVARYIDRFHEIKCGDPFRHAARKQVTVSSRRSLRNAVRDEIASIYIPVYEYSYIRLYTNVTNTTHDVIVIPIIINLGSRTIEYRVELNT